MIGRLARVPLREVWKHEAHDFATRVCRDLAETNEEAVCHRS